ncbi:hypothetical protein EPUL_005450 [Erysiphe pulchra]|uniref:Ras GEF n=1 Tax=Erysiphe pulchra TaxID=225359 RepID=A0A2S4PWY2_9PEZI|nr:hypothetical protein EPUL_005450 [Erysiphe pulchra]
MVEPSTEEKIPLESIVTEISQAAFTIESNISDYHSNNRTLRQSKSLAHMQITPPVTPMGSFENINELINNDTKFPNFLRATYPFNPTHAPADNAVTLEFNEGDIILVHTTHINGWADGTILTNGERGWLPTNYCKAYEPEPIRILLISFLNLWEQVRYNLGRNRNKFPTQELMRCILAGVRYLLERTQCLTKDSVLIEESDKLRRIRRALLSDLSSLVKYTNILQEVPPSINFKSEELQRSKLICRDMMLNAFRLIRRGARFLDVWNDEVKSRPNFCPEAVLNRMAPVVEETKTPPTTPVEFLIDSASYYHSYDNLNKRKSNPCLSNGHSKSEPFRKEIKTSIDRISSGYFPPIYCSSGSAQNDFSQSQHHPVTHGISSTVPVSQRQNFASERLNSSHDTLLSFLGSLIGRLHSQSQPPAEFISIVEQFVLAGQELLSIVKIICDHDPQGTQLLLLNRNIMQERIHQLVKDARETITCTEDDEITIVTPNQKTRLLMDSTTCVKAAGECVAKTKFVLERIGDFEFESQNNDIKTHIDSSNELSSTHSQVQNENWNLPKVVNNVKEPPTSSPPPVPFSTPNYQKPLPEVPPKFPSLMEEDLSSFSQLSPLETESHLSLYGDSVESTSKVILPSIPVSTDSTSLANDLLPLSRLSTQDANSDNSLMKNCISTTNEGCNIMYLSSLRNSDTSMTSMNSTRATTPDPSLTISQSQISYSELSLCSSQSISMEDQEETECRLLEKTFAHELVFNREGGIIGGSLAALVERLTLNDSSPDISFIGTFFLTFRLFVTPEALAIKLIERSDYAGENSEKSHLIRMRIYNVFKTWLEYYWCRSTDFTAINAIELFATNKLQKNHPGAGQKLKELLIKISSSDTMPYTASFLGKTSSSVDKILLTNTQTPNPIMTKNNFSLLRNWKLGEYNPTILDFDPLELARQLTICGMKIFCSIRPEELLASRLSKKSNPDAPNVRAMAAFSTDLSQFVWDTILQQEESKKRANILKHWIKIAQKCLELNNYDCMLAIVCSINSSSISRLKKTWEIVSQRRKDLFKSLLSIASNDHNCSTLRQRQSNHAPPCLPFIGIYLTDLGFADLGNAATRPLPAMGNKQGQKVINFDKYILMAKIISHIQRFQLPYRLHEVPELQDWFLTIFRHIRSSLNGADGSAFYYEKSKLLEPRDSHSSLRSPTDISFSSAYKEKFDIFGWVHKDRSSSIVQTLLNN